jgi:thioredoxin 1
MSSSENITTLTDSTFDEHVGAASTTVVVDFWAEWCGPCKMIAPILDEISEEQVGRLGIAKLNVDENPNIAMRYQVQSIPTMLVFKDGELVDRIQGAMPKGKLMGKLEAHL